MQLLLSTGTSAMTQAANSGRVWCGLTNSVTTVCSTSMGGRKSTTSWGRTSIRKLTSISGPCRTLSRQEQWHISVHAPTSSFSTMDLLVQFHSYCTLVPGRALITPPSSLWNTSVNGKLLIIATSREMLIRIWQLNKCRNLSMFNIQTYGTAVI